MGAKQSKLKKELAALKEQATLAKTKHDAEVEALKSDKRELQFKLNVLQELTAQAQLEAEKATQAAVESEERMKALKWELVRKLTVSTSNSSPSSTSFSSAATGRSTVTSLAASESASPRVALSWKLRDGVELRRSASTMLSTNSKSTAKITRPHAQSEPALPHKQTLTGQEPPTKSKPQDSEKEQDDARSRSDAKTESGKSTSVGKTQNSNNEEKEESKSATTALQSVSAPSSSPSSFENESRSKYPALSRKKSTQGLDGKAAAQKHEERKSPFLNDVNESSSSEPESGGNKAARGAAKDQKNPQRTGKLGSEDKELSFSDDEASS